MQDRNHNKETNCGFYLHINLNSSFGLILEKICLQIAVLACTLVCLSLVQSAPVADPEPFVLPTVTGALTIALPAVAIPGFGVRLKKKWKK